MSVEFGRMKRSEIRQAAAVAARAFDDYEYFTNWFPEKEQRNRIQFAFLWREFKTNFRASQYLVRQLLDRGPVCPGNGSGHPLHRLLGGLYPQKRRERAGVFHQFQEEPSVLSEQRIRGIR